MKTIEEIKSGIEKPDNNLAVNPFFYHPRQQDGKKIAKMIVEAGHISFYNVEAAGEKLTFAYDTKSSLVIWLPSEAYDEYTYSEETVQTVGSALIMHLHNQGESPAAILVVSPPSGEELLLDLLEVDDNPVVVTSLIPDDLYDISDMLLYYYRFYIRNEGYTHNEEEYEFVEAEWQGQRYKFASDGKTLYLIGDDEEIKIGRSSYSIIAPVSSVAAQRLGLQRVSIFNQAVIPECSKEYWRKSTTPEDCLIYWDEVERELRWAVPPQFSPTNFPAPEGEINIKFISPLEINDEVRELDLSYWENPTKICSECGEEEDEEFPDDEELEAILEAQEAEELRGRSPFDPKDYGYENEEEFFETNQRDDD